MTLARPSSAMSRLTVAWVTSKPSARQLRDELALAARSGAARDERAGSRAWRSRLTTIIVAPVTPRRRARRETRVPNVGSSSARASASGADAVGDDRLGVVPGERRERRPDLGHHAARDRAVGDERLGLVDGERVELACRRVADAVDVGHQDELARAEPGREARRGVVRVDVADDAVLVPRERRDDRHLAARPAARRGGRAGRPTTRRHEARGPGRARPISRPPSTPDSPTASQPTSRSAATSSLLTTPRRTAAATSSAAASVTRSPPSKRRRDAQPLEPLGHPLAAAVDEHDRPLARDRGDLGQDLALVGERRAAELDDDDLAHVVYSVVLRHVRPR